MKIFFKQHEVAQIQKDNTGINLIYNDEWKNLNCSFPISITMPLAAKYHGPEKILPWIMNLLPEGDHLKTIARIIGASTIDPLPILSKIGRDTAGAISFFEPDSTPIMATRSISNNAELEQIIEELPKNPFLAEDKSVSMSLAGMKPKIGVHRNDDGQISIPINGAASTWILKPNTNDLPGEVYNEALCMRLAALMGFNAPEINIGRAGVRKYFLIKRYDRNQHGNYWHRLHQEDMCQALGRVPDDKYEHNNNKQPGPTIRDLTNVMKSIDPVNGIMSIFNHVIFNAIICNTDAHAKNYSIMISPSGARLAPVYDVLCTKLWPDITKKQAMSLAKKRDADYFKGRHWQREAALNGVDPALILRQVENFCQMARAVLPQAVEDIIALDPDAGHTVREVEKYIVERIGFLQNGLAEQDPDAVAWANKRLKARIEADLPDPEL